jgi:hypothetical protein
LGKNVVTATDVDTFLRRTGTARESFIELCEAGWLSNSQIGTEVFRLLQQAGYSGDIDDLWSSVYNIVKPSKATAGRTPKAKRKRMSKQAWIHFIASGQTRKPGSHKAPA